MSAFESLQAVWPEVEHKFKQSVAVMRVLFAQMTSKRYAAYAKC